LIRTQTTTYSKVPLRKDTAVVNTVTGPTALGEFPGFRGLYDKKTFYDTYFGVGFPVKLDFKKKMAFSISPTFGISSYAFSSFATNPNNPALRYIAYTRELSPFFLCKGQLSTSVAPVDIVLGGEYRSVIGKNNYLTLYLGASIAIDKLKR
jgi:hypothetical protein